MVVAIASTRKPNVAAIKAVFERLAHRLDAADNHFVFLDSDVDGNQILSEVIGRMAKQKDVRSMHTTRGIFSQDLTTRQALFEAALTSAVAPFYSPTLYRAY